MPDYDYHCPGNGRTVSVRHSMLDGILTWGELCRHSGEPVGDTPADSPVQRVMSGGFLKVRGRSFGQEKAPTRKKHSTSKSCCGVSGCGPH